MRFYVIRHGLSEGNAAGVMQGHSDSPLTTTGQRQADLLGRWFKNREIIPDKIYASPLRRAYETAQNIASAIDQASEIKPVDAFKEIDIGDISGLSIPEVMEKFPGKLTPNVNKWLDFSAFGGESFDEFFDRVGRGTRSISGSWENPFENKTLFFVTHAGVMRPLLKSLLDTQSDFMYYTFGNCAHVNVIWREVRGKIRKVIESVLTIEQVAVMMGETAPSEEDKVYRSM